MYELGKALGHRKIPRIRDRREFKDYQKHSADRVVLYYTVCQLSGLHGDQQNFRNSWEPT